MWELFPPFEAHPLLRNGHAQTLAALFCKREQFDEQTRQCEVALPDGDTIVLHDDCPEGWQTGGPVALLIHGLAGCHASPYMRRIASKLRAKGVRTFRMDLRGCGAGLALAKRPYHAGRSGDALAALSAIAALCPHSPVTLVGFSLGGNIALKLLGERPADVPANLRRAIAICPPIDLARSVQAIGRGANRLYDRYFARLLARQVADRLAVAPQSLVPADWPQPNAKLQKSRRLPRGIAEFDEVFTAPLSDFVSAANYYRLCSSARFLTRIEVPTLIVAAADDPLVPVGLFEDAAVSQAVALYIAPRGGHLGFISRGRGDPDRRWMDWRVVDWCTSECKE